MHHNSSIRCHRLLRCHRKRNTTCRPPLCQYYYLCYSSYDIIFCRCPRIPQQCQIRDTCSQILDGERRALKNAPILLLHALDSQQPLPADSNNVVNIDCCYLLMMLPEAFHGRQWSIACQYIHQYYDVVKRPETVLCTCRCSHPVLLNPSATKGFVKAGS